MSCKVIPTPRFKKQAKKLLKKYRSLADEPREFEPGLLNRPAQGQSLGNNVYKVRIAIKSKGKVAASESSPI